MAMQRAAPRKRRTRQHVIADLAVHHVEHFVLEEGHTVQRLGSDYGYDLIVWTFDRHGYAESGAFYCQVKAMERLHAGVAGYAFDVDIRDYNLWIREEVPVILILFDATRRRAYWLAIQQYFHMGPTRRPARGARSIRVVVPKRQVVNRRAISTMRELKKATANSAQEEQS